MGKSSKDRPQRLAAHSATALLLIVFVFAPLQAMGPLFFHADAMRQTAASARKHMAGRARAHGQSVREQHKQECCRRQGREKNGDNQEYFVAIHDRSLQPAQARRA